MKVMTGVGQDLLDALPPGVEVTAGDTRLMWDEKNDDEVSAVKATFEKLKKKGYLAFRVNPEGGGKGEQIQTFDPKAAKLIMAPPMQGG
jgi:hypothetical protein